MEELLKKLENTISLAVDATAKAENAMKIANAAEKEAEAARQEISAVSMQVMSFYRSMKRS